MDAHQILISMLIGGIGGTLGGLFGIGGGLVIIPLLTIAFGSNPHLYQAASLVTALLVTAGSVPRHIKARAIHWDFALRTIPFSLATVGLGISIGVWLPDPAWLERIFAVFLLSVAVVEVRHRLKPKLSVASSAQATERRGWGPAAIVGSAMGTLSGVLGIGGGVVAVPLMRVANRFDIRTTIATSALLVLPTVIAGALLKFATLASVHAPDGSVITVESSLALAGALAPGAFFGAYAGAALVHRVPMGRLSLAFAAMCALLSIRMLGFTL